MDGRMDRQMGRWMNLCYNYYSVPSIQLSDHSLPAVTNFLTSMLGTRERWAVCGISASATMWAVIPCVSLALSFFP